MNEPWPTERDAVFGCELWTGRLGSNGRPIVWRGRAPANAHVIAWERVHGRVPPGKVLDHLCRRELCVRVDHLELVTKAENERRKSWRYRCLRARCSSGHSLEHAIVTPERGRLCRHCQGLTTPAAPPGVDPNPEGGPDSLGGDT